MPEEVSRNGQFVIYDLETTGLAPGRDEIIQIAAVRFLNGVPVFSDSFFSFARPQRPIPHFITSYTGIQDSDVRNAPTPCEVLLKFSEFVRDSTLIAHNGLRFDSKFLTATCLRLGRRYREVPSIDSVWLSKEAFGGTRGTKHNLDILLSRLGLSSSQVRRHDARGDVHLLAQALESLWIRLHLPPDASGIRRHSTHLPTY